VFLGDGLILEAVGGKTEAEIKTEMSHIPTDRVHVAAIEGATVEEIKYGIENGWLPEKTAYTVIHAGRAEVEANENALISGNQDLSESIGQKIGGIYTVLIAKTQSQSGNATSVIFSGIIPPSGSSVHSSNINQINGNNGIKSIVPVSNATNQFIAGINDADLFKVGIDGTFQYSGIITDVASANRVNQQAIRLASKGAQGCQAPFFRMGAQGCQAPFFWIKIYRMVSAT
jgi:hypothetical protein